MQGIRRKVVYVSLYETIAVICSGAGLAGMSGANAISSTTLAVVVSSIAVAWNVVFTFIFEAWEIRQITRGRSLARRIAHAIGFEGGLALFIVPLIAWWLNVNLWQALMYDMMLLLFFLFYTFAFNWVFDKIFGLPVSAMPVSVKK